jgi:DNA polymerase
MKEYDFNLATSTSIMYHFLSAMEDGCSRCTLSEENHKPIIYRGNEDAKIMLVGEAPGKVEQEEKKPFVGPAGQLLDKIMEAIGTPKTEQLKKCKPFLENLIRIIRPNVIIACGGTALKQLSGDSSVKITEWEGKWISYKRKIRFPIPCRGFEIQEIPMFCMTHPAAILHKAKFPEEQKEMKLKVWKYMKLFRDTYKEKINE